MSPCLGGERKVANINSLCSQRGQGQGRPTKLVRDGCCCGRVLLLLLEQLRRRRRGRVEEVRGGSRGVRGGGRRHGVRLEAAARLLEVRLGA